MLVYIIFISLIILMVVIAIWAFKPKKTPQKIVKSAETMRKQPIIKATEFKPGYIMNSPQKIGDQCNDTDKNILYPVNSIYVNYDGLTPTVGTTETSFGYSPYSNYKTGCDTITFNEAP